MKIFLKRSRPVWKAVVACFAAAACAVPALAQQAPRHNIILFVADGLRHGSVTPTNAPSMTELRAGGVDFVNSHSLFPTITTPNASAIATGHYIGDTGNFGNTMFLGFAASDDGQRLWPLLHGIENNRTIADLNTHFSGNYLGEESLISAARTAGLNTAVVGKLGPALVQDVTRNAADVTAENVGTVFIDDGTGPISGGMRQSPPLRKDIAERIVNDPYFRTTYFNGTKPAGEPRSPSRGANAGAPTREANVHQQQYFADTVTHAILPTFVDPGGNKKPFVLVYWSRDPDGTQHNAGDSAGKIVPGVNSETTAKAVHNADDNLRQILAYLKATPDPNDPSKHLADTTDVFLTSDHGFGTVSHTQIDEANSPYETFATKQHYRDVAPGRLPLGFFSVDLAHDLDLPLFDPGSVDQRQSTATRVVYKKLRLESEADINAEHTGGAALIGGGTVEAAGTDASVIVVSNGGADLIYFPPHLQGSGTGSDEKELAKKIAASAAAKPYISGIFADTERLGDVPGALSLSDIYLAGSARTPRPAMVVNFRTFSTDAARPEMTGVQMGDTGIGQGYGQHGTYGRNDTYNCMMAIGPDFKKGFADSDPVSNADIAITLSQVAGVDLLGQARGKLHGRVMSEALAGGHEVRGAEKRRKDSQPAPSGEVTSIMCQIYKDDAGQEYVYIDAGGFAGRSVGVPK